MAHEEKKEQKERKKRKNERTKLDFSVAKAKQEKQLHTTNLADLLPIWPENQKRDNHS